MKVFWLMILIMSFTLVSQPSTYAQSTSPAQAAWKEKKYSEFLEIALEREKQTPDFSAIFNVALGYLMVGNGYNAKQKAEELHKLSNLTEDQIRLTDEINEDIRKFLDRTPIYIVRTGGTAVLSKDAKKPLPANCKAFKGNFVCADTDKTRNENYLRDSDRSEVQRSASKLALTPEEGEAFVQSIYRGALTNSGYDITNVVKTKLSPED